jgi:Starch-binding associating with outer membrane/Susd and RagB outer membrane lipoprotein
MLLKNIKSISLALGAALIMGITGCKSYFGDVNVDPNAPNDASPAALLLSAETRLVYTIGGDIARFSSLYTQQTEGFARQFQVYYTYGVLSGDVNTMWDNLYSGTLADLKLLQTKADAGNFNMYGGIARALQAHALMMIADYFGDAPFSTGFAVEKQLQPTYDTQAQLYTTIIALLNDARTKFAATPGSLVPTTTDIIYGGSAAKWIKYCNVLSARAYLHQGKLDAGNYAKALAELAKGGFASSADDARFGFSGGGAGVGDAPWAQFNSQRAGDIIPGKPHKALLTSLNDPRAASYSATMNASHPIFTPTQSVGILTFTEQKFIEAECRLKQTTPDTAAARTAMLAGIQSSFTEAKVATADVAYKTYIAQTAVNPKTAPVTLKEVMTQKYLALYTDPEVFNDWRRTNIPALTPAAGSDIPRRMPYPQSELDLNGNTPKGVTIFGRVGWDVK